MSSLPDLVCLSHLRWDFVYQRPQHLMSRFARERRVFFYEEPIFDSDRPNLEIRERQGVHVITPHLQTPLDPKGLAPDEMQDARGRAAVLQRALLDDLVEREEIAETVLWYYTPMALQFTRHLPATRIVYDCMDELSAFLFAPPVLRELERELLRRADVVFTGGQSLYESKRRQHPDVHCFPSSVDARHFRRARERQADPADQASIPHPRLGFYGVIDERMDLELITGLAALRPHWHIVLVGPTSKLEPEDLQAADNIHMLGPKSYEELPTYLAGWDVAILPFARNEATRFISPTKTPEYLAGGKPVVSTPIRDVVSPYGDEGLVRIASDPQSFAAAVDAALRDDGETHRMRADGFLRDMSWDRSWAQMNELISTAPATIEATAEVARV